MDCAVVSWAEGGTVGGLEGREAEVEDVLG
jgi:hypothetical protein